MNSPGDRPAPAAPPGSAAAPAPRAPHPIQICPNCAATLDDRSCKLVCPQCHYFLSCSDFY